MRCIDRNGDITGYRIRAMTSGEDDRMETFGDVREATISGLIPSTEYTVSVAAVNSQDTGPYSDGIVQSTSGKLVSLRVEEFLSIYLVSFIRCIFIIISFFYIS